MIACVPASTSPTTRTWGNAPTPSPRPLLDRPNAWLAGLSGTSRPVHHHNPPVPVPRAPRLVGRQRPRSLLEQQPQRLRPQPGAGLSQRRGARHVPPGPGPPPPPRLLCPAQPLHQARSEEHTSELQSHHDLVCRLLLEKKKKKMNHKKVSKKTETNT